MLKKILFVVATFTFSLPAFAQDTIPNLSKDFDYEEIGVIERQVEPMNPINLKQSSISETAKNGNSGLGETVGRLSVSLTGAADYDVPIMVPPGINTTAPLLSINYNSQGGNGLLGYGWNIKGLSTISKIPSTLFHDGVIDPVDYDTTDRFALDGERLILKSGIYGEANAEYSTESFSNLKIFSRGNHTSPQGVNYGPSYFEIIYPDGSKAFYGLNDDSRTTIAYAITYWENTDGVRISYEYSKYKFNTIYIKRITYGSISTNPALNTINFNYADNTDEYRSENGFVNGVEFVKHNYLSDIIVTANGTNFRKYNIENNVSITNANYRLVTGITESSWEENGNIKSHSKITFSYDLDNLQNQNFNSTSFTQLNLSNIDAGNAKGVSLDANGDGNMDFALFPLSKNKIWLFKDIHNSASSSAFEISTGNFIEMFSSKFLNYQNKILDGDGVLLVKAAANNQVAFSTYAAGSSIVPLTHQYTKYWSLPTFQNITPTSTQNAVIQQEYISGDFDGDGLSDVLAIGKPYTKQVCYEYNCGDGGNTIDPVSIDVSIYDGTSNQTCITCNSQYVPYSGVHFINLKTDLTTNFVRGAGSLTLPYNNTDQLLTADFNGDGKTDIAHITAGKIFVYSLDNFSNLQLLWQYTNSSIKVNSSILIGDFNGDGKSDFIVSSEFVSNTFMVLISTGKSFLMRSETFGFANRNSRTTLENIDRWNRGYVYSGYKLIALDANGDGKTDIIEYNTKTYSHTPTGTQQVKVWRNIGSRECDPCENIAAYFKMEPSVDTTVSGNLAQFPIPVFLSTNRPNKSLSIASISNNRVTHFNLQENHQEEVLLTSVVNNGLKYKISYGSISEDSRDLYGIPNYVKMHDQIYPYVNLNASLGTKIVSGLEKSSISAMDNIPVTKQTFAYQGAVFHATGLGFTGFTSVAQSNWHTGVDNRIFTIKKFDPLLRGALISEYSMNTYFQFDNVSINTITRQDYQYTSELSPSGVFKLTLNQINTLNTLEGTNFIKRFEQYDIFNNPGKISLLSSAGSKVEYRDYENSLTESNYYVGRLVRSKINSTIGSDVFRTEKEYYYDNYRINHIKSTGNGTPSDYEDFEYDGFGNIKKITSRPDYETPREASLVYDSTGRFVITSTDVAGLNTTNEYNNNTGSLIRSTNHLGQETLYEYDSWGRNIKTTDYLGNVSNLLIQENSFNYNYSFISSSNDGSYAISTFDSFGRISQQQEKNMSGDLVKIKYQYDALGRLHKESEPYIGFIPSQWTETIYDIYNRPISVQLPTGRTLTVTYNGLTTTVDDGVKTISNTKDQLGNLSSVTESTGTINYSYFGNGNLKSSSFNGSQTILEQDGWGRKSKLIDPSAGTYTYYYDGFGAVTKETTPKGTTDYSYSNAGLLLNKQITGDNTNMFIAYNRNPSNLLLDQIAVTSSDGNNISYVYQRDRQSRVEQINETTPFASFIKDIEYDALGRIETEKNTAILLSNSRQSIKKIKNIYENGYLKQIVDFDNNSNLYSTVSVNARNQTISSLGAGVMTVNTYDNFGNITDNRVSTFGTTINNLMHLNTSFDSQRGTLTNRSNSLFSWSESFSYDNLDRLLTFKNIHGQTVTQTYDNAGRKTASSELGDFSYLGSSYKINEIELNNQGDLYYQQKPLQQVKYNAFQRPFEIFEQSKERITFQYNAFNERSNMFYGNLEANITLRNKRKHYSSDGSMEITHDNVLDNTDFVTYIGGDAYSSPIIYKSSFSQQGNGTGQGVYNLHRDYLGSIIMITDNQGVIMEKRLFDAWGDLIEVRGVNDILLQEMTFLDRGYTGHEHLQGVGLINMNARLYDSKLRSFLSPDNYVQDLTNSQNYNRYAYALNNPLMYNDPSGNIIAETAAVGAWYGVSALAGLLGIASFSQPDLRISDLGDLWDRTIGKLFKRNRSKSDRKEYASQSISSDPGSNGNPLSLSNIFSGKGIDNGGLGIKTVIAYGTLLNLGVGEGIANGFSDTVNFVQSLGSKETWTSLGGRMSLYALPHYGPVMLSDDISSGFSSALSSAGDAIQNIPNMGPFEIGNAGGYVAYKTVEVAAFSYAGGAAFSAIKGGAATVAAEASAGSIAARGSSSFLSGGKTFAQFKATRGGTQTLAKISTSTGTQRISTEFHHVFLTQRMQRAYNLPNWAVNNRLNVWKLNTVQHSLVDPYRYNFLRAGFKTDVGWFGKYNWFTKF